MSDSKNIHTCLFTHGQDAGSNSLLSYSQVSRFQLRFYRESSESNAPFVARSYAVVLLLQPRLTGSKGELRLPRGQWIFERAVNVFFFYYRKPVLCRRKFTRMHRDMFLYTFHPQMFTIFLPLLTNDKSLRAAVNSKGNKKATIPFYFSVISFHHYLVTNIV